MTDDSGSPGPDLLVLANRLSIAKRAKEIAAARVLEIEIAIVAQTNFEKPEGQETFREDDDRGACSLVLQQPITTKVDGEAWLALRRTLPPKHPGRAIFRAKYELDTKAARALQEGDADAKAAFADVSDVITRKPGKVSVEIKTLEIREAMPNEPAEAT